MTKEEIAELRAFQGDKPTTRLSRTVFFKLLDAAEELLQVKAQWEREFVERGKKLTTLETENIRLRETRLSMETLSKSTLLEKLFELENRIKDLETTIENLFRNQPWKEWRA